ncbi:hypothetical protein HanXRQr2_Chr08g0353221 [Helianthus annuus]|uniref:Uncharacterized protein n=1 Tax=Helianthus annuus TaxID=4232 RepID=A0A9K3NDV7_HELAN|nr:hypothetical protein HanXRQr2_Chr08g0353221 [Helianthus annuus]KAJ0902774.1 hypothetical protein HanPSC8_Chr08g0341071 [Helianthus annuus]
MEVARWWKQEWRNKHVTKRTRKIASDSAVAYGYGRRLRLQLPQNTTAVGQKRLAVKE